MADGDRVNWRFHGNVCSTLRIIGASFSSVVVETGTSTRAHDVSCEMLFIQESLNSLSDEIRHLVRVTASNEIAVRY